MENEHTNTTDPGNPRRGTTSDGVRQPLSGAFREYVPTAVTIMIPAYILTAIINGVASRLAFRAALH
jgi:hypothetical protein